MSKKEKEKNDSPSVVNKKALHDYQILKKIEAGIVLQGSEVKACRQGKVQLVDAYAYFEKDELYLLKANISEFKQSGPYFNHPPTRKRKLLLHKTELRKLQAEIKTSGQTLVPLRVYFVRGNVKVELGLGKGKNKFDKRQSLKNKEEKRFVAQATKQNRRDES